MLLNVYTPGAVAPASDLPFIMGSASYDGPPIMPLQEVHLIAGSSGSGKTTLTFQLIRAMIDGEDFLGYPTQRHPMVYAAYDRGFDQTIETLRRVGIKDTEMPLVRLDPVEVPANITDTRWRDVLDEFIKTFPEMRVLFIDALWILVPHGDMNNYLALATWLRRMENYCKAKNITIVGMVHSAKQREGNKILNPRQQIIGSVAGAGFSACNILCEDNGEKNGQKNRTIHILPRNAAEKKIPMILDAKGCLVDETSPADYMFILEYFFTNKRGIGVPTTREEAIEAVASFGLEPRATDRLIVKLLAKGTIYRVKHGVYAATGAKEQGND